MRALLITSIIIGAVTLAACSQDGTESDGMSGTEVKETAVEHGLKHQDPNYVCPMHPQIVRDKPGNCPLCGMDLVLKEQDEAEEPKEKKILYWVAPMDAAYRRDGPGKSPMGMDLVPVYDEGGGVSVKISPIVEHNLGVRTAMAERKHLWRRIDTVGYVDFDENMISHIHLRTKGWIEKLMVKSEGERVKKGQLLFEVYSPELVNAQEEYIQALRSRNKSLIEASKERLYALGVSVKQTRGLKKRNKARQFVPVYAKQDGIVAKLNVREGMYVMPTREVMSLADLSSVWLLAEVFESQSDWVKVGQPAEVRLSYLPGREWQGSVEYIYPSLNEKTRTLKARLRFDNPDEALKPNMFADVTIFGGAKKDIIIIPREALIRAGEEERVILAMGKGRYEARNVKAGIESGDFVEIIEGITEGDSVVTSGQFLIDSEASLKASLQRMSQPKEQGMAMQEEEQPMKGMIHGAGVVTETVAGEQKIKIAHEPIEALGWPDMNMFFSVKDDVPLQSLKADDKVTFMLEKGDKGYEITSIKKAVQGAGE